MSSDLKPHIGQVDGVGRIWKMDTGTIDDGTAFAASVKTKAFEPGGSGFVGEVGDAILLASAAVGVTITDSITYDFGAQTVASTVTLAPISAETRISKRIENSGLSGVQFVQHQLGDGAAVSNGWTLDRLVVPFIKHDPVSE
jgi:hypothetical protein